MEGMCPADILALVEVTEPRISPDGQLVAYTVVTIDRDANRYVSRIWLAGTSESGPGPQPLTAGADRDGHPRWSPDGQRLAFVSHRQDGPGSQIWTIPTKGPGEPLRVLEWPEEIDDLAWSPDGRVLAFGARDRDHERYGQARPQDQPPRRVDRLTYRLNGVGWTIDRPRHLFVVSADGGRPPQLVTAGPFETSGLTWSPDGSRLAFTSARHETWDLDLGVDAWTVDVHDPEAVPVRLTLTGPAYARPAWSPTDPDLIAVVHSDNRALPHHGQVAFLRAGETDQVPALLTSSLDRNCGAGLGSTREPVWMGNEVVFTVEDHGNQHLYRVGPGAQPPQLVVGGERTVTDYDTQAGVLAYSASDPTHLSELFVLDPATNWERQVTHHGAFFSQNRSPAAPERFTAISPDGAEVEAWIMRPRLQGAGPFPAVVNIHGGPFSQYGNKFFDEFQFQVNAGYAVIYCNPRGSSGYSEAWGRAIRGPKAEVDPGTGWGSVDYDDVLAVTDEALRRYDDLDPDRVAVMGGSYGGYMTSWIIGHTDRFQAAVSERAVNNMLTSCWTSDIGPFFDAQNLGVRFIDDPEECLRISPITYVKNMRTPLLIIHSEDDLRCPVEQAEQLFSALRMLGRTPEFVRFPGENHELSRSGSPRHRVTRAEIIIEFLDRHLKQPGTDGAFSPGGENPSR